MAIHLVTDSTCDLPEVLLEKYNIHIIPLNVHFGDVTYLDKKELSSNEFYHKLSKSEVHPSTSQPSPYDFVKCYEEIYQQGDTIISIHLSSKLSGTIQSANIAKEMLPDYDIRIVDSELASLAMGSIVLEVAKWIQAEWHVDDILEAFSLLKKRVTPYFLVDTLEYLQKGGRIGKAQALVGSLLDIKPILTIANGEVEPFDKVRNKKKALNKIMDIFKEKIGSHPEGIALMYSGADFQVDEIIETLKEQFNCDDIVVSQFGPVIGVHIGPGAIGISMY